MPQSKVISPKEYCDNLPPEHRRDFAKLRSLIKKNLPKGYKEVIQYGMISYVVPLSKYPAGYLDQKDVSLPYLSLGSQKNYISLYLLNLYSKPEWVKWFKEEYKKSGKKLDMGKSCLRFKSFDELPPKLMAKAVKLASVKEWIKIYENSRK